MELALSTDNLLSSISEKVSELQEKFLNSSVGSALNSALDIGLRYLLPDMIEDDIIDLKDTIVENGLKEGVSQIVDKVKEYASSFLGIITGNFESVSQIKDAISSGGVIDKISNVLDSAIDKVEENGFISESLANSIKSIKNTILNTTNSNLSETLTEQENYIEQLTLYNENWKEAFENQDLDAMKEAYEQIQVYKEKTLTTESSYVTAEIIENLQCLIESNGGDFNLTDEELELAEKLY